MKIKLTESQIRKVKLITEGQEVVQTFMGKAEEIKDVVNRIYSKLTFSTLAELIEGDIDLNVISNKLVQLRTIMQTHYTKGSMFFDNMPEDAFYADNKWGEMQSEMEDTYQEITYHKIDVLDDMVDNLKSLVESEIGNSFKDIKKMDI